MSTAKMWYPVVNVNKIRKKEMLCTKKRYGAFFYVKNSKNTRKMKKRLTNWNLYFFLQINHIYQLSTCFIY